MQSGGADQSMQDIIAMFAMERHHLAGWFALHYSDSELLGRPRFSSLYHLIAGDEPMPRHRLDGIEVWHFYMGAPAEIEVSNAGTMRQTSLLGRDLAAGERPQIAVPAHFWQSCRSTGAWTLLGCTMMPGYSPRASFVLSQGGGD